MQQKHPHPVSVYHQARCCCYHCAPYLVNPPCRAEVINPSRVVKRSIESILVPKFCRRLISIAPFYMLCHLFLENFYRFSLCRHSESRQIAATVAADQDQKTVASSLAQRVICKSSAHASLMRHEEKHKEFWGNLLRLKQSCKTDTQHQAHVCRKDAL